MQDSPTEKAMAPHSSTLAWKILKMAEPGGLQSMGSLRVEHDWVTSLSLFTFMHWRSKWQPTPVFLPGESQGPGSLVGCCLWGRKESHSTERLNWTELSWNEWEKKCHCREPAWGIPPVTRSCGRGLMGKASQASGFPPGISWACTPKIRIYLPCTFPLFWHTLEKVNSGL